MVSYIAILVIFSAKFIGDPLSKFVLGRLTHDSLSSESSFQMMRDWLSQCETKHVRCPAQKDHILPTRIIHVGSPMTEPRLILPGGRLGKWVALSHCWGTGSILKTETTTLRSHCRVLPFSSLPPTFGDAVTITRALGLTYLWIDSLCILQDSKEDWLAESAQMGHIYKNAVVTLAADAAENSQAGIFDSSQRARTSLQDPGLVRIQCHSVLMNIQGNIFVGPSPSAWKSDPGPLGYRGWTLQEAVLATRVIQFTNSIVYWRCFELRATEVFPMTQALLADFPGQSVYDESGNILPCYLEVDYQGQSLSSSSVYRTPPTPLEFWYLRVVDMFSLRQLTHASDKLLVVAGIAKELQSRLGSDYKAGLWTKDFHKGLLWSPFRNQINSRAIRYSEYIAPSWSWASIDFPPAHAEYQQYFYRDVAHRSIEPLAQIKRIVVINVNQDPFGQVESASLELEGDSCMVCSCRVPLPFLDECSTVVSDIEKNPYQCSGVSANDYYGGLEIWRAQQHWRSLKELQTKYIGTQRCIGIPETKHERLVYIKIAQISGINSWEPPSVLGLILKPDSSGVEVKFTRVGRAMMLPNEAEDTSDFETTAEQSAFGKESAGSELWQKMLVTII
jgi:hypothetical protein